MYDCMTVRQPDHACTERPLLQVVKNALVVSWSGLGSRRVGQIGSGVRSVTVFTF